MLLFLAEYLARFDLNLNPYPKRQGGARYMVGLFTYKNSENEENA